jgi:hypothetical protein
MVMRAEVVAGGTEGSVLEIEDTRDSISREIAAGHRNPQQAGAAGQWGREGGRRSAAPDSNTDSNTDSNAAESPQSFDRGAPAANSDANLR